MKNIFLSMMLLLATNSILFQSCKKKSEAPTPTPPSNTPAPTGLTSSYYFQATINGSVVTFEDGIANYAAGSGDQSGSVPSGYQERQSTILTAPFSTKNIGGFQILKTFPGYSSSDLTSGTEIENMFHVQSYSYGKKSQSTATNGVDGAVIYYVDNNSVTWSTDQGTGDQTGSTFNITVINKTKRKLIF